MMPKEACRRAFVSPKTDGNDGDGGRVGGGGVMVVVVVVLGGG